jgi:hypothetical protein
MRPLLIIKLDMTMRKNDPLSSSIKVTAPLCVLRVHQVIAHIHLEYRRHPDQNDDGVSNVQSFLVGP